jgi:hypothetical protein
METARQFTFNTLSRLSLVSLFYLVWFSIYSWPAISHFSDSFLADDGDGYQNIWNLWWIRKAVVELHVSPWFTEQLHFPHGISLLAQTLNPFNGFTAIVLQFFVDLLLAHNIIIVFSFVAGGTFTFWFAQSVGLRTSGALFAGFVFTFSTFHFAHGYGHMQLIALEWIPIFLGCLWHFCEKHSIKGALCVAFSLLLVILCDYYYFLFCCLTGALLFLWTTIERRQSWSWPSRNSLAAFSVLAVAGAATSGIFVYKLLRLNSIDPLLGAHPVQYYSMDLFEPFIPGASWIFGELTQGYWSQVSDQTVEHSTYLGWGALTMSGIAIFARQQRVRRMGFFIAVGVIFAGLALGPRPTWWGHEIGIYGPYALLAELLPVLKLGGVPARMIVMSSLAIGILGGAGLDLLIQSSNKKLALANCLCILSIVELWPQYFPHNKPIVPHFIYELQKLDSNFGLLEVDEALGSTQTLYFQTIHGIPLVGGYVSRTPTSVAAKDKVIHEAQERRDWSVLCKNFQVRYVVAKENTDSHRLPPVETMQLATDGWTLFDLQRGGYC